MISFTVTTLLCKFNLSRSWRFFSVKSNNIQSVLLLPKHPHNQYHMHHLQQKLLRLAIINHFDLVPFNPSRSIFAASDACDTGYGGVVYHKLLKFRYEIYAYIAVPNERRCMMIIIVTIIILNIIRIILMH